MGTRLFKGVRVIDFEDRIADYIDTLNVGLPLFYDTTTDDESISLTRLPGGRTIQEYYDGILDKQLIYELTVKAKKENRPKVIEALGTVTEHLINLGNLKSEDNSFDFQKIEVSNEAFFVEATTDGFIYFRLHFQPILTIY